MNHEPSARLSADTRLSRIESTAWGILFIWIGVALLADLGWGTGLLGAGAIILGAQAWRKQVGAGVEGFSILLGGVFLVIGISNLLGMSVDIFPLLFIVGGIILLASAGKSRSSPGPDDVRLRTQNDRRAS